MTPQAAPIGDFSSLVHALQSDGAELQVDTAAGTIRFPLAEDWLTSVLWLRWDLEHTLLHVMLPLPEAIPAERLTDVESLIVRLNHKLVLPGFGLDHEHATAYFRLSVPRGLGGSLAYLELRKLLRTTIETVRDFAPLFRAVSQEGKSAGEALKGARGHASPSICETQ